MQQKVYDFWLHAYAMFTAAATLFLVCVGGLVTSHGAGLAVPDWPTTFGYNMFFFPFDKWVGGIFYEHTHRLVASGVGMLTVILAIWLWFRESRRWVRWLGIAAVIAVIAQGVLGGLRVTALKDELGIFHGALAQLFFILICSIALFTSRWWLKTSSDHNRSNRREEVADPFNVIIGIKDQQPPHVDCYDKGFAHICLVVTAAMFLQLVLGATMRHQHAGLAISDFPLAHGAVWPDTSPEAVQRYNQMRGEVTGLKEITAAQIYLQMAHRIMAVLLLAAVGAVAWISRRQSGFAPRISFSWFGLILIQAGLGAATIWTNKSADIATAHVAVGAVSLATGALLTLMSHRASGESVRASAPAGQLALIRSRGCKPAEPPVRHRHRMKAAAQQLTADACAEKSRASVFSDLFKLRLTLLVLLTTLVGFYVGTVGSIQYWLMANTVIATALLACGAAALNQLWEHDHDAKMRRTETRPLPSGRLQPDTVLVIGAAMSMGGLIYMAAAVNLLASFLGGLTLATYLFIYTPLKRVTWLNTAIGAIPGALPPLIGWTAARNELSTEAIALFAILFFWQIPHFLAIAWIYRDEYAKAGFVMLPNVDPNGFRTSRQAVSHTFGLVLVSLWPVVFGLTGIVYLVGAFLLGAVFLVAALRFSRRLSLPTARQLFFASILYLPLLLGLMVMDKIRW